MRILYITTIGSTMGFFHSLIRELIEQGHQIDIATNENDSAVQEYYYDWDCHVYPLSCSRSPLKIGNITAIKEIKALVSQNRYDIVHCHTPIAAACTRIACRGLKKFGLRVIYTAHGFHFFKGAPFINWVVYYPIEWICSWWTDCLITINSEDYLRAKRHFHANKIQYVPGVGIDTNRFKEQKNGKRIREELGIDGFMLLSVGELNENKNHEKVIQAIKDNQNITYVIVGAGRLKDHLESIAKEGKARVILTGYREDVIDFYGAADAYILPSYREGLNVSLMEAMASGLPCLCGRIRGNVDLIDKSGGYLFNPADKNEIRLYINLTMEKSEGFGDHNREKIRQFDIHIVNRLMKEIYGGNQNP